MSMGSGIASTASEPRYHRTAKEKILHLRARARAIMTTARKATHETTVVKGWNNPVDNGNSWTKLKNCGNGKRIRYKYQKSDLGADKNLPQALMWLNRKIVAQMRKHLRPEHNGRAQPVKNRKRDHPFGIAPQPARLKVVKKINLI